MRMTRNRWALVALLFAVGVGLYLLNADPRPGRLTLAIEESASANLKSYPYKFWVMDMEGDTAILSSPRSYEVPAARALAALYPRLNTSNPSDTDFIAAERRLGEVQAEARSIVRRQPGVKAVKFELDRDWLFAHNIEVPTG